MAEIKDLIEKTERVSQTYARKCGISRSPDWFLMKLQEELGELTKSYLKQNGQARTDELTPAQLRESTAEELADVFCHVLLFAKHNDIDIEDAIQKKWFRYL